MPAVQRTDLILVWCDDPAQLPMRVAVVRAAARELPAYRDTVVEGAPQRSELLTCVATLDRPCVLVLGLGGRTGALKGMRMLRTIRWHPRLSARCLAVALTSHRSEGVRSALDGLACAMVASTSPDVLEHLAAALDHATPLGPGDPGPCRAFPDALSHHEWEAMHLHAFVESFGIRPRLGDLLIVGNIARRVPDSVTDRQLADLGPYARGGVRAFKRAVEHARGVAYSDVDEMASNFVHRLVQWQAEDRPSVVEVESALRAIARPEMRRASYLTDDVLAVTTEFLAGYARGTAELAATAVSGRQGVVSELEQALGEATRTKVRHGVLSLHDTLLSPLGALT